MVSRVDFAEGDLRGAGADGTKVPLAGFAEAVAGALASAGGVASAAASPSTASGATPGAGAATGSGVGSAGMGGWVTTGAAGGALGLALVSQKPKATASKSASAKAAAFFQNGRAARGSAAIDAVSGLGPSLGASGPAEERGLLAARGDETGVGAGGGGGRLASTRC